MTIPISVLGCGVRSAECGRWCHCAQSETLLAFFPEGAEGVEEFCWVHDGYGKERSDLRRCEMASVECDKVVERLTLGGGEDGRIIGMNDVRTVPVKTRETLLRYLRI